MKKLNLLFIGLLSMSTMYAQDISDALRYSQDEIQGSARFRALSGAFGALGGDMSAVSLNPAGSAVFSQSHASFSIDIADSNNDVNYFGNLEATNDSNFNLNQGGAAFVFKSNNNSPWRKFTLAVAYEQTNNHDNNWNAIGTNTKNDVFVNENNITKAPANSIAGYFFLNANGFQKSIFTPSGSELVNYFNINRNSVLHDPEKYFDENPNEYYTLGYQFLGDLESYDVQQAFLGYQSFILDPDSDNINNSTYNTNNNVASGNFYHDYLYTSTGYNGKVSFNMAAQYEDNLYLGINLNSHFIDYQRTTSLLEDNSNGGLITAIDFNNTLSTTGNGFSFQLGGILKLSTEFRVGVTYDSPTWYTIEEETTQYLSTNGNNGFIEISPQVVNIHPQYKLQTPGKITGSLAYVFAKQGLISFDYSKKDYGATKFKPENDFSDLNRDIPNVLTSSSTYRLGSEYKVKQISFRGGYRFEESPYKDGVTVGDLTGFSLGLGYNFGNTKLDITFDQSERSFETPLYNVGLTDTTNIDSINSNITLSLSFNI